MNDNRRIPQKASRITCAIHSAFRRDIMEHFSRLGLKNVLVENGKSIRQYTRTKAFGLPGRKVKLNTSLIDLYRFTVKEGVSRNLLKSIIAAADLSRPGRGMIFEQSVMEYGRWPSEPHQEQKTNQRLQAGKGMNAKDEDAKFLLPDLSLISCVLSAGERTEQIARIALDLGTCVPVVTQGLGSGMRDYLGLLRVTIPPGKDVIQLIVPEYDRESIMAFLIEQGRLNLPGSGFLYSTPVDVALPDRMVRIGQQQQQAASIEQIITAIDELKKGTHWRKRFAGLEQNLPGKTSALSYDNREIVFVCKEGRSDKLMDAAIKAGAGGGTISQARRLKINSRGDEEKTAAFERGIICSPSPTTDSILQGIAATAAAEELDLKSLQVMNIPNVYTRD